MKKKKKILIVISLITCCALVFCSCAPNIPNVSTDYHTASEWSARYELDKEGENRELSEVPIGRPAIKCQNGTFVGNRYNDVDIYKGIPYAKQPLGELRFAKAHDPENSNKIFDATYFGKACMQNVSKSEPSSMYTQGEDCLNLNIWNANTVEADKKPVMVYIHGGGWNSGGTQDPLYDGYNFAHYNPNIIVVTITYRFNMLGLINLSSFPDGNKFETSINNALYDQVQALRWIHNNIRGFGGDANNVTIVGESAGGCAVSSLCLMKEARQYFQKAIPMSGSVNQTNEIDATTKLPEALKKEFNVSTVAELQKVPLEKLSDWWDDNYKDYYHHVVRDGSTLDKDPFKSWEDGETKDLIILQGHTADEFRYYQSVFDNNEQFFDAVCDTNWQLQKTEGSMEFNDALNEYYNALKKDGASDTKIKREYMDDRSLAIGNTYQALMHAKNGGKGYFYIFEQGYDGELQHLGAAHAIDCHYLFGNFNGGTAQGNDMEVDLSRKFQKMIANFCQTGNPSLDDLEWPEYNNDTRETMMIGTDMRVEHNPEKERIDAAIKMMNTNSDFRYVKSFSGLLPFVQKYHPEIYNEFVESQIIKQAIIKRLFF